MKIFCFLFLSLTSLLAQDAATITVQKGAQLNLHLAGIIGGDGAKAAAVLSNDLELSSAFLLGGADSANFTVSGVFNGSQLQGKVTDRAGNAVLDKAYNGSMRSAVHQFADDVVETITGTPGIASSTVAFVANASGRKEIYVADYDGANVRQLTHDGNISVSPSLSPGGRMLLYTGYQSGYADIYKIDLASGARNRIVKSPGTNSGAAWAPDGDRFAATLSKDGNPELYLLGSGGGAGQRLTRTKSGESSPSFSPDGGEIVYSSDASGEPQLYRISSGGGTGRLVGTGFGYCTEPSWSPDGKKIAFNVRNNGNFAVAVYNLGSGSSKVLTSGDDAEDPAWGRDSRHVIFAQDRGLYLLDVQTGKQVRILAGLGKISEPTWSH